MTIENTLTYIKESISSNTTYLSMIREDEHWVFRPMDMNDIPYDMFSVTAIDDKWSVQLLCVHESQTSRHYGCDTIDEVLSLVETFMRDFQ